MISFIPAKINLGLNIVRRRADGYHDLETVFYPIGQTAGTPHSPWPFGDILEIISRPDNEIVLHEKGISSGCAPADNLVMKAATLFAPDHGYDITIEKHIPNGAGLGGGSADATYTLLMLNRLEGNPYSESEIAMMALKLGADCPFFVKTIPAYAEGIGEVLSPVPEVLKGLYAVIVKPDIHISTREAFSGITPRAASQPLRDIINEPVSCWRFGMKNDFEESLFPLYPELPKLKQDLYDTGALYASMSGSGAALYGIYLTRREALRAHAHISAAYKTIITF